jgi:hypothetical protein
MREHSRLLTVHDPDADDLPARVTPTNMVTTMFTSVGNSADSRGLTDVTPCIATPNVAVERPPGGEAAQVPIGAREHHA